MSEDKKGSTASGAEVPPPPSWPPPKGKSRIQTSPGAPAAGSDPEFFAGEEVCGYTIKRKLAEGRTSLLYEGEHGELGRRGTLKVLKTEFCLSEDAIERFFQEARGVNALRHENIALAYDFARDSYGRVVIVTEHLEGESLSSRLERGALPWSEASPILEQTLGALKAAHDKGFVHRALRFDRIWLRRVEGRVQVKLLDFGIANLVSERPKTLDPRTDIRTIGAIAYEMLAGAPPSRGEESRLADIPAQLDVPASIAEIVDRMLAKDPAVRYQSVTDVLADLRDASRNQWPPMAEGFDSAEPELPPPPPPPGRVSTPALFSVLAPEPGPEPVTIPTVTTSAPKFAPGERLPVERNWKRTIALAATSVAVVAVAVAGVVIWKSQPEAPKPAVVAPEPPPPVEEKPPDYEAIRRDAQATLRASLKERDPAVRMQGADALGQLGDPSWVTALTELAEKDPDPEVSGHAAVALGMIGASSVVPQLVKLEAAAPPPLKVRYAAALARLGGEDARERLLAYANDKDLAVSFQAVLALADVSPPGDLNAIAALGALALHASELDALVPNAGVQLLAELTARHDASARKRLHALLEEKEEGPRLAAAAALAKLGDDAGKQMLQEVLANKASPNRLAAAVALIPLGEYRGLDLITAKLDDKDREARRRAARALGEIGDRRSIPALQALASNKDWTLRVAAAAALVTILGLDPKVLAQASAGWAKRALDSQDRAVREAAAGVLADLPEKEAVPLLVQALADQDLKVRLAAARNVGRMKGHDVAAKVAARVKAEPDPGVKEQLVKALGEIGNPAAREALVPLSEEPGRIGVIAAGALIAVGEASGQAKLEAAAAAPQADLRLAAMQAASIAKKPVVVPVLKTGVADASADVRLAAAEGLAAFKAEAAAAIPVLTAALASKDAAVLGRVMAAFARLGEQPEGKVRTPAEMLDSPDPRLRLAVVPIVRAMPASEGVPFLRRLVADLAPDVRRAGVDAIEVLVPKAKNEAIRLYKLLLGDADPVVRAKASGQLARLLPPSP